jgi:hypothetical protein
MYSSALEVIDDIVVSNIISMIILNERWCITIDSNSNRIAKANASVFKILRFDY